MSDLPTNDQIKIRSNVAIEKKEDQGTGKLTEGIVKTKLTSSNIHPHGIKVELEDGNVGRVKKILFDLSSETKTTSDSIPKTDMTIPKEEDSSNELKSSFRTDIDRLTKGDGKIVSSKSVEKEISITISAMANKEGGQLFIGINDNGEVLGLDSDYELLNNPNDDKFQRIIWQSIQNYVGNMTFVSKLDMTLIEKNPKKICVITIPKSNEPIFVNDNNNQESYVRVGTRSEKFTPQDFLKYCKTRFDV
jgi:uncharacterized repeat protein (TIGR03833 family)